MFRSPGRGLAEMRDGLFEITVFQPRLPGGEARFVRIAALVDQIFEDSGFMTETQWLPEKSVLAIFFKV